MSSFRAVLAAVVLTLLVSPCASAQAAPRVQFRPFGLFAVERFTAATTFDATLGSSFQPLWGGGVEITTRRNVFVDVAVTRLSRNGHQAFVNDGQVFRLAVPLEASLTPVEFTIGYRFPPKRRAPRRRRPTVIPYAGVGIGVYRYAQTSGFAGATEEVDETHAGFLAVGGAEFRVSKWIGITADAQYTWVPGILGQAPSISQLVGEHDLGGIAGRVRVILGR